MELYLFRPAEYDRIYNCTWLNIDSVPLAQRRRFVPEATIMAVLCCIYYLLYVPCMCSFWKRIRDNPCYQFMFYIGLMDLAILWMPGFFSGWLSWKGAVFCSYPNQIYIAGSALTALWIAERHCRKTKKEKYRYR